MSAKNAPGADWSAVIPFYNEEHFLGSTLMSLVVQTCAPACIILVDNGSTDGSRALVEEFTRAHPEVDFLLLEEATPGKASALKRGVAAVETAFVATCDADTYYPPTYLAEADRLFRNGADTVAAVLAFGVTEPNSTMARLTRAKGRAVAWLMPTQTHSGGYGQSFRTDLLRQAGGFGPEIWPYCLMDHEVIHRISRFGEIRYAYRHWCAPSARRADRGRVRWSLAERLLYHVIPRAHRDWFFYSFLTERFARRRIFETNLREQSWSASQAARRTDLALASDA